MLGQFEAECEAATIRISTSTFEAIFSRKRELDLSGSVEWRRLK